MLNILLTGANGFIGTYFKKKYQDKYAIKTFSFLNDDFEHLELKNIDCIIHLSALVHQKKDLDDDIYKEVNVTQTLNLAKKAKEAGVKHFIFMSTIAVYGKNQGFIKRDDTYNPLTKYGRTKLEAELLLNNMQNTNFTISIIRPSIVNGYKAPGNLIKLIHLIQKVPVLPFGKIKNKRSMVYVGNLCHLIDEIILQKKAGAFLSSDEDSISTSDLIKEISSHLDKNTYLIKILFFENILKILKPSIHQRLYKSLEVDTSDTNKDLNFKNLYTIKEGIKYTIKGEILDA